MNTNNITNKIQKVKMIYDTSDIISFLRQFIKNAVRLGLKLHNKLVSSVAKYQIHNGNIYVRGL